MWRTNKAENYVFDSVKAIEPSSESQSAEASPRPQDVFFEAGAVLAGALGLAFASGWLLTAMGISS